MPGRAMVLRLAENDMLGKTLVLPLAAERQLGQVLAFEWIGRRRSARKSCSGATASLGATGEPDRSGSACSCCQRKGKCDSLLGAAMAQLAARPSATQADADTGSCPGEPYHGPPGPHGGIADLAIGRARGSVEQRGDVVGGRPSWPVI
jgi:hypothetical protein